jgi:hypothetical protein
VAAKDKKEKEKEKVVKEKEKVVKEKEKEKESLQKLKGRNLEKEKRPASSDVDDDNDDEDNDYEESEESNVDDDDNDGHTTTSGHDGDSEGEEEEEKEEEEEEESRSEDDYLKVMRETVRRMDENKVKKPKKNRKEIFKELVKVQNKNTGKTENTTADLPYFKNKTEALNNPTIKELTENRGVVVKKFGSIKCCCVRNLDDDVTDSKHTANCFFCNGFGRGIVKEIHNALSIKTDDDDKVDYSCFPNIGIIALKDKQDKKRKSPISYCPFCGEDYNSHYPSRKPKKGKEKKINVDCPSSRTFWKNITINVSDCAIRDLSRMPVWKVLDKRGLASQVLLMNLGLSRKAIEIIKCQDPPYSVHIQTAYDNPTQTLYQQFVGESKNGHRTDLGRIDVDDDERTDISISELMNICGLCNIYDTCKKLNDTISPLIVDGKVQKRGGRESEKITQYQKSLFDNSLERCMKKYQRERVKLLEKGIEIDDGLLALKHAATRECPSFGFLHIFFSSKDVEVEETTIRSDDEEESEDEEEEVSSRKKRKTIIKLNSTLTRPMKKLFRAMNKEIAKAIEIDGGAFTDREDANEESETKNKKDSSITRSIEAFSSSSASVSSPKKSPEIGKKAAIKKTNTKNKNEEEEENEDTEEKEKKKKGKKQSEDVFDKKKKEKPKGKNIITIEESSDEEEESEYEEKKVGRRGGQKKRKQLVDDEGRPSKKRRTNNDADEDDKEEEEEEDKEREKSPPKSTVKKTSTPKPAPQSQGNSRKRERERIDRSDPYSKFEQQSKRQRKEPESTSTTTPRTLNGSSPSSSTPTSSSSSTPNTSQQTKKAGSLFGTPKTKEPVIPTPSTKSPTAIRASAPPPPTTIPPPIIVPPITTNSTSTLSTPSSTTTTTSNTSPTTIKIPTPVVKAMSSLTPTPPPTPPPTSTSTPKSSPTQLRSSTGGKSPRNYKKTIMSGCLSLSEGIAKFIDSPESIQKYISTLMENANEDDDDDWNDKRKECIENSEKYVDNFRNIQMAIPHTKLMDQVPFTFDGISPPSVEDPTLRDQASTKEFMSKFAFVDNLGYFLKYFLLFAYAERLGINPNQAEGNDYYQRAPCYDWAIFHINTYLDSVVDYLNLEANLTAKHYQYSDIFDFEEPEFFYNGDFHHLPPFLPAGTNGEDDDETCFTWGGDVVAEYDNPNIQDDLKRTEEKNPKIIAGLRNLLKKQVNDVNTTKFPATMNKTMKENEDGELIIGSGRKLPLWVLHHRVLASLFLKGLIVISPTSKLDQLPFSAFLKYYENGIFGGSSDNNEKQKSTSNPIFQKFQRCIHRMMIFYGCTITENDSNKDNVSKAAVEKVVSESNVGVLYASWKQRMFIDSTIEDAELNPENWPSLTTILTEMFFATEFVTNLKFPDSMPVTIASTGLSIPSYPSSPTNPNPQPTSSTQKSKSFLKNMENYMENRLFFSNTEFLITHESYRYLEVEEGEDDVQVLKHCGIDDEDNREEYFKFFKSVGLGCTLFYASEIVKKCWQANGGPYRLVSIPSTFSRFNIKNEIKQQQHDDISASTTSTSSHGRHISPLKSSCFDRGVGKNPYIFMASFLGHFITGGLWQFILINDLDKIFNIGRGSSSNGNGNNTNGDMMWLRSFWEKMANVCDKHERHWLPGVPMNHPWFLFPKLDFSLTSDKTTESNDNYINSVKKHDLFINLHNQQRPVPISPSPSTSTTSSSTTSTSSTTATTTTTTTVPNTSSPRVPSPSRTSPPSSPVRLPQPSGSSDLPIQPPPMASPSLTTSSNSGEPQPIPTNQGNLFPTDDFSLPDSIQEASWSGSSSDDDLGLSDIREEKRSEVIDGDDDGVESNSSGSRQGSGFATPSYGIVTKTSMLVDQNSLGEKLQTVAQEQKVATENSTVSLPLDLQQ